MARGQLSDSMPYHEKILNAGNASVGAWARMLAWSAGQGTDGFIPALRARSFASPDELDRLVMVQLLDIAEGGYRVHGYLDVHPSAARGAQISAARAAAGKRGGQRSGAQRRRSGREPHGPTE